MGNILYFDCSAGISGDMAVASLIDLGADKGKLDRALASLQLEGFEVKVSRVTKNGLDACDFDVVLDADHDNHDHDMDYLYGNADGLDRASEQGDGIADGVHHHVHGQDDACHRHDHGRDDVRHRHDHHHHHDHDHDHDHRCVKDVFAIIDAADMTDRAKKIAHDVFSVLAAAEAKAHGVSEDEVHFHEVGAVDSIVDVVAFAVCLDDLDPVDVVVEELAEGRGTVRCQHGVIPVPVPAVVNIVSAYEIPLRPVEVRGELVTPTGAAFVAVARTRAKLPERFSVLGVGLGAGKRVYPTSGVVRAMLLREV